MRDLRLVAIATALALMPMSRMRAQTTEKEYHEGIEFGQRSMEAQAEASRLRRQNNIEKRKKLSRLKDLQERIVPLESSELQAWKRGTGPNGPFWKYEIKRGRVTIATATFSPKYGYVVDARYQESGMTWPTLDEAIEARFNDKELWGLPDIPGWKKSHLLTSEQNLAELKRETLEAARPQAVEKMAKKVADKIVDQVGPTIENQIASDLGLGVSPPPEVPLLKFDAMPDDNGRARYQDPDKTFLIRQVKKDGNYEVVRQAKEGRLAERFELKFSELKDAIRYASEKAIAEKPVDIE